jgi:hypothetical protein
VAYLPAEAAASPQSANEQRCERFMRSNKILNLQRSFVLLAHAVGGRRYNQIDRARFETFKKLKCVLQENLAARLSAILFAAAFANVLSLQLWLSAFTELGLIYSLLLHSPLPLVVRG